MSCNIKILIYFLFIQVQVHAYGQKTVQDSAIIMPEMGWYFGVTPTALMATTPNLQFSTSYMLKRPFEINMEYGGMFYTKRQTDITKMLLRAEVLYYPFKNMFFLTAGYHGVYYNGEFNDWYRHQSLTFDQRFSINRRNYQHYGILGGGLSIKMEENLRMRIGGRFGRGVINVKGDPDPSDFESISGRRVVLFSSFTRVLGKHDNSFFQPYLNFSFGL